VTPFLLLLFAGSLLAVDGTVINKTTNQPAAGAPVTLMRLGDGGMMPLGTVKAAADGKFRFEQGAEAPLLLQATFDGVTYNKLIRPGEPSSSVELPVFATSKDRSNIRILQHMMLLEPNDGRLNVSESIFFQNTGNVSFADPANGSYRFQLPPGANGQAEIRITGAGGMPLNREAEPAGPPNTFKISYPLKPGETRVDMQYSLEFSSPGVFPARVLHAISPKDGVTRIVTPSGVQLSGDGIDDLGVEPQTQAQVYALTKANTEIQISGTGSLRALDAEEGGSPEPRAIAPRLMERKEWIFGISLFALALGFLALYKRS
jgi:hypothetical protein